MPKPVFGPLKSSISDMTSSIGMTEWRNRKDFSSSEYWHSSQPQMELLVVSVSISWPNYTLCPFHESLHPWPWIANVHPRQKISCHNSPLKFKSQRRAHFIPSNQWSSKCILRRTVSWSRHTLGMRKRRIFCLEGWQTVRRAPLSYHSMRC